ncbi:MAG: hypothetical protein Q8P68_06065 [Candidatus Peregrinibacteria bacterium]|nr:hypothetical protein [Candidatus Peregrinibacteria bacterium]MDZ4244777.1 hypothetical protein [Candidatus Gracilibacteria bacterium]
MPLTVNSDFIIFGKEPLNGFSTNFFYSWADSDPSHTGELYINFSIVNSEIDGEEFAQELFEVVRHHYFKDFTIDPHERFEQTLNEVNKLALEWREKKQVKFFSDLNAVIGVIQGDTLYMTQSGYAEAYLIRKRHVSTISEGLTDNDKDRESLFVNVASGQLEDYDTVIFSTTRLLRYLPKNDMAKLFTRDASLASCFADLRESVEMEVDHQVNVLALNIIHQKSEASLSVGQMSDSIPTTQGKAENLVNMLKGVKGTLSRIGKKRGKNEIEKSAENMHVKTRTQGHTPLIDLKNLTDLSSFGKDKILVLLVVIIVVLLGSLYFVRANAINRQRLSEFEEILTNVQQDLDEAATRGTFDKEKAANLIARAEQNVHTVLDSGEFRSKALTLLEEVKAARDQLDNIVRVESPLVLADLTELKDSVLALGLLPFGEDLYAYEYDTVHKVMLDKVQAPMTVDANEQIIDGVYFADQDALAFLTKSHKVIEFADNFVKFMDTRDPAWKSSTAIEAYGARLYMLDPAENSIWKYRRSNDGYTGAELYSTEGDITNAVDFAIDGAVYVLKSNGEIVKYYAGEVDEEFYVVRQPQVPMEKPTKIFTEFEFNQVYILEPSQLRVLAYNKDLKTGNLVYSHQYHFDNSIGVLKDMYVDKDTHKIYVLTDSKIYQLDI